MYARMLKTQSERRKEGGERERRRRRGKGVGGRPSSGGRVSPSFGS